MGFLPRRGVPAGLVQPGTVAGQILVWNGTAWVPSPLPTTPQNLGAVLVLESDAGLPAVGNPISQWNDQSGLNHHAIEANPALQPIAGTNGPNGETSVDFDAIDDRLVSAFALPQPTHVFAIAKARVSTLQNNPRFWDGASAGNTCGMFAAGAAPGSTNFETLVCNPAGLSFNGPAYKAVWNRYNCAYNGASSSFKVGDYIPVSGTLGTDAPNGFVLNDFSTGGANMGASFVAFIVFPRILNALETARMNAYLTMKYGTF